MNGRSPSKSTWSPRPDLSSMNYFKPLLALAVAAFAIFRMVASGAISRPPGEIAPGIPEQTLLENAKEISFGEYRLHPQARYDIEARVLSVERYRVDAGS